MSIANFLANVDLSTFVLVFGFFDAAFGSVGIAPFRRGTHGTAAVLAVYFTMPISFGYGRVGFGLVFSGTHKLLVLPGSLLGGILELTRRKPIP